MRKISKAEKLVNEQMLAILEWASDNPGLWHPIGQQEATRRAVELLEKRGVIDVQPITNAYRLRPQPKPGKK